MRKSRNGKGFFVSCLLSQCFVFGISLVLLSMISVICLSLHDPDVILKPAVIATLYISSTIGGVAAMKYSSEGIAAGAFSGVITAVLLFLLSFLPLPTAGFEKITATLLALAVIPCSVLGSYLAMRKENPKKRRKNMMKKHQVRA